jgi:hypothetical protein
MSAPIEAAESGRPASMDDKKEVYTSEIRAAPTIEAEPAQAPPQRSVLLRAVAWFWPRLRIDAEPTCSSNAETGGGGQGGPIEVMTPLPEEEKKHGAARAWQVTLKFLRFMGPGALISVAYIDPDNYQTNIQSGQDFQYKLLFMVLVSNVVAIYLQVSGPFVQQHSRE